jgi:Fanconi anemia group M protein
VGEEGIDIPATDLVLFYEPVPSEIRSIQRKGRTGRARAGRVVVLMAKGTRDEAYYWISDRKEKTMHRQMRDLSGQGREAKFMEPAPRQAQITGEPEEPGDKAESLAAWQRDGPEQIGRPKGEQEEEGNASGEMAGRIPDEMQGELSGETVGGMPGKSPARIFVDAREREMARLLESQGLEVTVRNLEVGDYVVSEKMAIERKTAQDFVSSLIDPQRNLFRQIGDLARTYDRPVLILEGRDLYTRQVAASSIRGALASLAVDYGVPIIPTEDMEETASVLALLAKREQKEGREPKLHGHKTARTLKEQQEYLISSIPSVGPAVARNLLRHFGSIEGVMKATQEELQEVEKVGPKIAERIRELVGGEYKG